MFSVSFPNHDIWSKAQLDGNAKLARQLRPWVAAVRFAEGRTDRTFISGATDLGGASGLGGRGVELRFALAEGIVYEVYDPALGRSMARRFVRHDGNGFADLTREDAERLAMSYPAYAESCVVERATTAKRMLGVSVLDAARARIADVFDQFPKVYVSFSAGKDSTVMLHLVAEEARKRGVRFGCLLIDLEAQYQCTIGHGVEMFREYADVIEPYWVALPIILRNAVSQYQPRWTCWDPEAREAWVRSPPDFAVTDGSKFPFYRHAMEFEEFVEDFGHWYGGGELTACLVGIRAQESLNRFRSMIMQKTTFEGRRWTTWKSGAVFNAYPLYDWETEDVWRYHAATGHHYNRVYDAMHRAGLTVHQARICQPYGDDQRKGLWLFSVIEPHTWAKVVARVGGANTGALYAHKSGNMMGRIKVNLPTGHTWESFASLLLGSMPPPTREHYENKIAVFIKWYADRGVSPIPDHPDDAPEIAERFPKKGGPSWFRIVKTLLKNDWWCKGLSFSQHKSHAYASYQSLMRRRREAWGDIKGMPKMSAEK